MRKGARSEFQEPDYSKEVSEKKYFTPRTTHAVREQTMATVEVNDGKVVLTGFYGRVLATPELVEEHIEHLQEAVDFIRNQD